MGASPGVARGTPCPSRQIGAGDGNRTRMTSLEGWSSAIELHPRGDKRRFPSTGACSLAVRLPGGEGPLPWRRTPGAQAAGFRLLTGKGRKAGRRSGAVDETRTRDLNLGKVALYQLSYYRAAAPGLGLKAPEEWCGRRDLNSYAVRHQILSLARLPVPPRPRASTDQ